MFWFAYRNPERLSVASAPLLEASALLCVLALGLSLSAAAQQPATPDPAPQPAQSAPQPAQPPPAAPGQAAAPAEQSAPAPAPTPAPQSTSGSTQPAAAPSPAPAPAATGQPVAPSAQGGSSAASEAGGITEDQIKQILVGKELYLRGGYLDDSLTFNENGKLVGRSAQGSYTLCGVEIDKVRLTKHKVAMKDFLNRFLGTNRDLVRLPRQSSITLLSDVRCHISSYWHKGVSARGCCQRSGSGFGDGRDRPALQSGGPVSSNEEISTKYDQLLSNNDYLNAVSKSTADVTNVGTRLKLAVRAFAKDR